MKKALCLLLVVLSAISLVSGQTQSENSPSCKITLAEAPVIRGLRLNIDVSQLAQILYPSPEYSYLAGKFKSDLKAPNYGKFSISAGPHSSSGSAPFITSENFSDIESVTVNLFDNQVTSFAIYYPFSQSQKGTTWSNVTELIGKFSEILKLPKADFWQIESEGRGSLKCVGFEIKLQAATQFGGQTSVYVGQLKDFDSIVNARRNDDMQKRREAFKP